MGKNNEGNVIGLGTEMARGGYEASVVSRMSGRVRAHSPKGAAGNALEIMANDKSNLSNFFKPDRVTKSSTATQVDAVTTKAVKGSTGVTVGITAAIEVGKLIANGDSVGECTGHVVSKGTESVLSAVAVHKEFK